MESKLFSRIEDQSESLNCTFRKIKFDIFDEDGNIKKSLENGFRIFNCESNTPLLLLLEPEIRNINKNNELNSLPFFDVKISIELIPDTPKNMTLPELKENNLIYSNSPLITTTDCSPKTDKNDIEESKSKENKESNFISNNNTKKRESIKSSIKRQLTSNPHVDICRNPEWPFIKKSSKVISRNHKLDSFRNRNDSHTPNIDLEDLNVTKKAYRGRTRQWLESLSTLFDGIYTQRSTLGRSAGLGLFSDRLFEKNDIITEFVGWVIDRKEALRLRSEGKATHICDLVKPSLYLDGEKDPKPFIGGGSFANDGSIFLGGPGNNSKFWKWYDEREGRTRVFLKATQRIKPNEEIFVGYCKDYWVDFAEKDVTKLNQLNTSGANRSSSTTSLKRKRKNIQFKEKKKIYKGIKKIDFINNDQNNSEHNHYQCLDEEVEFNISNSYIENVSNSKCEIKNKNSSIWDINFNWSTSDEDDNTK